MYQLRCDVVVMRFWCELYCEVDFFGDQVEVGVGEDQFGFEFGVVFEQVWYLV